MTNERTQEERDQAYREETAKIERERTKRRTAEANRKRIHNERSCRGSYESEVTEALRLTARIKSGLTKHANRAESEPGHWGYVGDLIDINNELRELVDKLHLENEYT